MTDFAALERAELADLLAELGPDQPTLCAGWTTRDLAAHLIVRQSRAVAAAGIVLKPLAGHTARVQAKVARRPWPRLLQAVRKRPWWGFLLDEAFNRAEYFIHIEDIRRAQPDWHPRELPAALETALWSRVRGLARLVMRRTPAEVTVSAPGHGTVVAGRGGPAVTLVAAPSELLLFLSGRQAHALVELSGPAEIVERMRHARYRI